MEGVEVLIRIWEVFVSNFKIVGILSGQVLEPGICQVRSSNAAAIFDNFLVKAWTAKQLLSCLNEVHKNNVQWGGQVCSPDREFTRLKIFDKLLLINLGNVFPSTKFFREIVVFQRRYSVWSCMKYAQV